ncbi:EamA family transporter [Bradyrhizobium sp. IC4060]|uniref:EamA family transporter n=1 Tax=Bradyrhizobium sp. IC4060 TaxID=2793807 RepID=UPI00201C5345|nr:EamA family transporter [Bradyrhizobium sp. IC4060]MCA1488775.1 EamA family transporter [Bradyrhizobium sp. IC4061]
MAQIILRKAMLMLGTSPSIDTPLAVFWIFMVYLCAGLACYAIGIFLWLAVLSSNEVSVAYPMLAMGYVIAVVFSSLLLGETLPLARVVGIGLICVGVLLISRTA